MINKIKKGIFFIVVYLIFPTISLAADVEYVTFTSEINVNKNKILNVKETYDIYFVSDVSYIDRTLDKTLKVLRKDKSSIKQIVKIDNISGDGIKVEEKDKTKKILIDTNSKESLVDEIKTYDLSYDYNLGNDTGRNYDELYYNIVSNLEAPISNLTFEFTFEEDLKDYKIDFILNDNFLSGDEITYDVDKNIITGYLNIMLDENSTFAIRIELPNNYFTGTTNNFNYFYYLTLLIPIISLAVVIFYWFKYGRGNKFRSKYTYFPPKNYDPAEIGYLYKGKTEEIDLTSLLIHLANKGYIRFEEDDDGYKLGRENTFRIIKVKDYDLNNAASKILFDGLFKESDICELSNIEYSYFNRLMDSKKMLDNKNNRKKMFNLDINKVKIICSVLIFLSICFVNFYPFKLFTGITLLVPVMIIANAVSLFILFTIYTKKFIKIVFGLLLSLLGLYAGVSPIIGQNNYLFAFIVGIALIIVMLILYSKLSIRTKYGNQILSDIYGFKVSLESISSIKLKEQLKENSNYFYDMVPYAYVLGILDTWMDKGKNIINEKPSWHSSQYDFDLRKESKFVKNVLYTTTQVMLKRAYSNTGIHIDYKQDKLQTNLND